MQIKKIRNIGIVANFDAGKSTLTQRLFYLADAIQKEGKIHNLEAAKEYIREEQKKAIMITSAAASLVWNDCHVNIVDTPGHLDFDADVERVFKNIDGILMVFCAVKGVDPHNIAAWRLAERFNLPVVACINRMDVTGADFKSVLLAMEEQLNITVVPFQIPLEQGPEFRTIIDPVEMKLYTLENDERKVSDILAAQLPAARNARRHIIEQLAEFDEDIFDKYEANEKIEAAEIWRAARECTINRLITPVFYAAAYHLKGVHHLLDMITGLLPSPLNRGSAQCHDLLKASEMISLRPLADEPLCAMVLKVVFKSDIGRQTFVRIFSGEISIGDELYIARTRSVEKASRIFRITPTERIETNSAGPGEIVMLTGLNRTVNGATLSNPKKPVSVELPLDPLPVVRMGIAALESKKASILEKVLQELSEEDYSLVAYFDSIINKGYIAGTTRLHLQTVLDDIRKDFKTEITTGKFKSNLFWSVTGESEAQVALSQNAKSPCIKIRLEPAKRGRAIIENRAGDNSACCENMLEKVGDEIKRLALTAGAGSYPVINFKVVILSAERCSEKMDEKDILQLFSKCFMAALPGANLKLNEPIVKIEVAVSDELISSVIPLVTSRRGYFKSMRRYRKGSQKLIGFLPLIEAFDLEPEIDEVSNSEAIYSIEYDHLEPARKDGA